jgi:hypothetical protein
MEFSFLFFLSPSTPYAVAEREKSPRAGREEGKDVKEGSWERRL